MSATAEDESAAADASSVMEFSQEIWLVDSPAPA